jgi:hypothetical protein
MNEKQAGGCRSKHQGFACTRKVGHAGRHTAKGINGVTLATWAPRVAKSERTGR